jgi:hypothetical protein
MLHPRVISGIRREVERSALFWDITQRMLAIPYCRFGTTYWSRYRCVIPQPSVIFLFLFYL